MVFDLDGVVRRVDLAKLWIALEGIRVQDREDQHGYWNLHDIREPLLNPCLFALPDDEIFIITNCLSEEAEDRKREWVKHFFGDRVQLITISIATNKWGREYVDPVAEAKLRIILAYRIDVYFDDDPAIVRRMRELIEEWCVREEYGYRPVILKYGPWLREWY